MATYIGVAPPEQTGIIERYRYTGDGSTTVFSGNDVNGKQLRYTSTNPLLVFLNGVQLIEDIDFTKTSNTQVTFTTAPASNDDIEMMTFGSYDLQSPSTLRENMGLELSDGEIFVGSSSDVTSKVTPSGDATISNTGAITVASAAGDFNVTDSLTFSGNGSASTPLISLGDTDTGIYRNNSGNYINFTHNGTNSWLFGVNLFQYQPIGGGPGLRGETASSTNPTVIPYRTDSDTGIGAGGSDELYLITGGATGLTVDSSQNVTITNDLTVDTNTLHVDSTNNRVGIGTASPNRELTVYKASYPTIQLVDDTSGCNSGSNGTILQQHTGDGGFRIRNQSGCAIIIENGSNSCNLAVQTTGNVAIACNLTIGGNLTVNGTTTTINTATLDVEDLNITIACGAANAAAANGAGITVDGAAACLTYGNTNDDWTFNKTLNIAGDCNKFVLCSSDYLLATICPRANSGANIDRPVFKMFSESTERIRFDTSGCNFIGFGNFGLGTTSPSTLLHLSSADPQITITDTDGTGSQVIKASGDDLQMDVVGKTLIDSGNGGTLQLADDGTSFMKLFQFGSWSALESMRSDCDFKIRGNDGGSFIDALSFDMSEAGAATFNDKIVLGANKAIEFGDAGESISGDGTNLTISSSNNLSLNVDSNGQIQFRENGSHKGQIDYDAGNSQFRIASNISNDDFAIRGNDGGSYFNAVVFDMSEAGAATFNDKIVLGANKAIEFGDPGETISGNGINLNLNSSNNTNVNATNIVKLAGDGMEVSVGGGEAHVLLSDGTTQFGHLKKVGNNLDIRSSISDGDITLRGNDGGTGITALTLDMSEAGAATFNDKVTLGTSKNLVFGDPGEYIYGDGTNLQIVSSNALGIDTANGIVLDSGSGGTTLKAGGGTIYGCLVNSSGDLIIKSGTTTALTFSGADVTAANDLTVTGNLTVNGTTTTINTATLDVEDLNITIACGAANAAAANGAGITVDGAAACLTYGSTCDAWSFNKGLGIGTTSPSNFVHIQKNDVSISGGLTTRNALLIEGDDGGNGVTLNLVTSTSSNAYAGIMLGNATTTSMFQIQGRVNGTGCDQKMYFYSPGGRYDFTNYGTTTVCFCGSNVGIGTGTPATKLHVEDGEITISDGTTCHQIGSSVCNLYFGSNALNCITTGTLNVAIGAAALACNTTGAKSIAIGTCALYSNVTGNNNVAIGVSALLCNTIGDNNIAIGCGASALSVNAARNTAIGTQALYCNSFASETSGYNNAIGFNAMRNNASGQFNEAVGSFVLCSLTTGSANVMMGYASGNNVTSGSRNIAVGSNALQSVTTQGDNVAIGTQALSCNEANYSTVVGSYAGRNNTTANGNVAIGACALCSNTTGGQNVAIGYQANCTNVTGSRNTVIGYQAGSNNTVSDNTLIGYIAGRSGGSLNTYIGSYAAWQNTGSNNVGMGQYALSGSTNSNFNVAIGRLAGNSITTGAANILIGYCAGNGVLTTGGENIILGVYAEPSSASASNEITLGNSNHTVLRTAADLMPFTDNAQNIGSASCVWANIYSGDLHLNNMAQTQGNSVDGTKGNWTLQEGRNDLFLINNNTGKKYRFKIEEIE